MSVCVERKNSSILGVDIGVSAVKIVRMKDGAVISTQRIESHLFDDARLDALLADDLDTIAVTGMGASRFSTAYRDIPVQHVDEFSAIASGALHLSGLVRAVVASVGTGTAFVYAEAGQSARHLGGSGVGGGTLLGLSRWIDGDWDAVAAARCAESGDLQKVDICIADVTDREIPGLPPYTTVANFAKRAGAASDADRTRGVFNLVAQTVGMLSVFAARAERVADVVLIGTPMELPLLRELICRVELLHPVRFHIPPFAPHAAAVGAALTVMTQNT